MKGFCSGEAYAGCSFIFLFHLSFSEDWTENRQTGSRGPCLHLSHFVITSLHLTPSPLHSSSIHISYVQPIYFYLIFSLLLLKLSVHHRTAESSLTNFRLLNLKLLII